MSKWHNVKCWDSKIYFPKECTHGRKWEREAGRIDGGSEQLSDKQSTFSFSFTLWNQRHCRLRPTPEMLSLSHFLLSSLKWFSMVIVLFWHSGPILFPNHNHSCFSQLLLPRNTYSLVEFAYASLEASTMNRKQIKLGGGEWGSPLKWQDLWHAACFVTFLMLPAWRPSQANDVVTKVVNPVEF